MSDPRAAEPPRLRRSRNGCRECRRRHTRCDEAKPVCSYCGEVGIPCEYSRELSWGGRPFKKSRFGECLGQLGVVEVPSEPTRSRKPRKRYRSDDCIPRDLLQSQFVYGSIPPLVFVHEYGHGDTPLSNTHGHENSCEISTDPVQIEENPPEEARSLLFDPAVSHNLTTNPELYPLSTRSRSLVEYFQFCMSRSFSCHKGIQDDICHALLPMALNSPHLMASMLCAAASHRFSVGLEQLDDVIRLQSIAMQHLNVALASPSSSEWLTALGSSLVLCMSEIVSPEGTRGDWLVHLSGASALMRRLKEQSCTDETSLLFMRRFYASLRAIAAGCGVDAGQNLYEDEELTRSNDFIDDLAGFSTSLVPIFKWVSAFEAPEQHVLGDDYHASTSMLPQNLQLIERVRAMLLVRHEKFRPEVSESLSFALKSDFWLLDEAYHHMALLQLYERTETEGDGFSSPIQHSVTSIITAITAMDIAARPCPGVATLPPLFAAGRAAVKPFAMSSPQPHQAVDSSVVADDSGARDELVDFQHYIRPSDGKLVPLATLSFEDAQALPPTARWSRLGKPPSRVPSLFYLSYWIWSSTLQMGTKNRLFTYASIGIALLKLAVTWPLVCIMLFACEFFWQNHSPDRPLHRGSVIADAQYDIIQCVERPQSSIASIPLQAELAPSSPRGSAVPERQSYVDDIRLDSDLPQRSSQSEYQSQRRSNRSLAPTPAFLRPTHLCFVRDNGPDLYETVKVSDLIEERGDHVDIEFIFISYTRMHFRVATDEEIDKGDYPDEETRAAHKELAKRDRQALINWGIDSAKQAGKEAFWLDFECVREEDNVARSSSNSDEVYRICDIVRTAHSVIIAIGPTVPEKISSILEEKELPPFGPEKVTPWLRQWGSRLWTLPELLLCPSEHRIKLYILGDPSEPKALAKRNFAERAWDDAESVKELVNHYEGSAILSQVQFIDAALACFSRRKTDQFSQGDIAYAIMGLLSHRQRPSVNQADSGFQAFAKLSLANDSGAFLERLICVLPPRWNAPWHDTTDTWGVKLSDIDPTTRVSEVAESDTILLSGVLGGMIQWDRLDPHTLSFTTVEHLLLGPRIFMAGFFTCLHAPKTFSLFFTFLAFQPMGENLLKALLIILAIMIIPFALAAPQLLLSFYEKTEKSAKARLIGVEGFVDAGKIEKHLYGFNFGRFTLTQSHQRYRDNAEVESPPAEDGHAFTLVDTFTKTVTHFRSQLPPVAMLICGQEGGKQRALLCSYDSSRNAYCRQTVLRVSPQVLDKMFRVDGVRFSLASQPSSVPSNSLVALVAPRADQDPDLEVGGTGVVASVKSNFVDISRPWMLEIAFILIILVVISSFMEIP
ncbi:hypothetical protein AK830_g1186 [Neonectria ditissima]|uniref:Zn(2)-C6 fungal-type domain-containing protein n=1 Tax=Neonectria ditissima TaxID=78410 RepID=A0A0P7BJG1_9HYPO|nr:hypothetical protein AK830_g1186 [Neonectria ditissima]